MVLRNLDQILEMAKGFETKQIVAVAGAAKDAVIDAVLEAVDADLVTPILVGETAKIQEMLVARGRKADEFEIVETYEARENVDKYCYRASRQDIAENDYNLNIPRYVDTFEEEELVDIDEVKQNIAAIEAELAQVQAQMAKYLEELGL